MTEVYALHTAGVMEDGVRGHLLTMVSPEKRTRIRLLRNPDDAHRTLFSELLLRFLVMRKYGIPNREICLDFDAYNKPFLRNFGGFHFNTSHSGRWIVCALDRTAVGIDVEFMKEVDPGEFNDILSPEERKDLFALKGNDRLAYFYRLWTLKESYSKATGEGLNINFGSLTFKKRSQGEAALISGGGYGRNFFFRTYNLDPFHALAVCSQRGLFSEDVRILGVDEIIKSFAGERTDA